MSEYEMISLVSNCVIPWKSLDACNIRARERADFEFGLESKEKMMECFNCKKDECDNCHDRQYSNARAIRMKETGELFMKYYYAGLCKAEICEAMHITATTYRNYVQRFIKGNYKRY